MNRTMRYLRLSLTASCHMRCMYCRPEIHANSRRDEMSPAEIETLVRHLVENHGVMKVRLTGGDPTARPDLVEIVERLAGIGGIELAMTTNGLTMERMAQRYAAAGLQRVNISLDTLEETVFARMTGVSGLARVLSGIDAALASGLNPVKLNTVVLRGINEESLPDLVDFAAGRGLELRLIELMPMGPLSGQWEELYLSAEVMMRRLDPLVRHWQVLEQGSQSARPYRAHLRDGRNLIIGFITPMSCNFCAACNRIRITASGLVYPCLMDVPRGSLLPAIRPEFSGERCDRIIAGAMRGKKAEHPHDGFAVMTQLGG